MYRLHFGIHRLSWTNSHREDRENSICMDALLHRCSKHLPSDFFCAGTSRRSRSKAPSISGH